MYFLKKLTCKNIVDNSNNNHKVSILLSKFPFFANSRVFSAIIEELYMVFTFSKKSKVAFVYFGKRLLDRKEGEKLSSLEPKVTSYLEPLETSFSL